MTTYEHRSLSCCSQDSYAAQHNEQSTSYYPKLDGSKLQSQQTAEAYTARLSALLNRPDPIAEDPGGC